MQDRSFSDGLEFILVNSPFMFTGIETNFNYTCVGPELKNTTEYQMHIGT